MSLETVLQNLADAINRVADNMPSTKEAVPSAPSPATEAAEKPATPSPAAEKPAAEKPAAEKPAAEKPAAEKPAAEKPAAPKEPAATISLADLQLLGAPLVAAGRHGELKKVIVDHKGTKLSTLPESTYPSVKAALEALLA